MTIFLTDRGPQWASTSPKPTPMFKASLQAGLKGCAAGRPAADRSPERCGFAADGRSRTESEGKSVRITIVRVG